MAEYINKAELYNKLREREGLIQRRVDDTPATINGALSPCYTRYSAQLNEVTRCRELVADIPTEDVRPVVRGRWIGHREHCENLGVMPSGLGAYEWCSKCDCGIDVREWQMNNYNYCPNCGADMREVEE